MMAISRMAEAAIYVKDLARVSSFYAEILGLPKTIKFDDEIFLRTGPNSTLILFEIESLKKRVSVMPGRGKHGQGHVTLAVPAGHKDAWRLRLQKFQVPIEHEQRWPLGTDFIYCRDPDDKSIELIDDTYYRLTWQKLERSSERE